MDGPSFRIGRSSRGYLIVSPTRREFPGVTDSSDGNWVHATITIAAGAFRAEIEALLRSEEFVRFRDELLPLHEKLVGRARFETMEEWLSIDMTGDGKGHFEAECVSVDQPGTGNCLTFDLELDQTDLLEIIEGLEAIIQAFPVVGTR